MNIVSMATDVYSWRVEVVFGRTVVFREGARRTRRADLRISTISKILRLRGTLAISETPGTLVESGVSVLDSLVTVQQMHHSQFLSGIVQRPRGAIIR